VEIAIDATGKLYWDGDGFEAETLDERFTALAKARPETEIHLYADRTTRYDAIADVMATASRAGLTRISFVTQPEAAP
jgi:biopolymer transport protein ExbD